MVLFWYWVIFSILGGHHLFTCNNLHLADLTIQAWKSKCGDVMSRYVILMLFMIRKTLLIMLLLLILGSLLQLYLHWTGLWSLTKLYHGLPPYPLIADNIDMGSRIWSPSDLCMFISTWRRVYKHAEYYSSSSPQYHVAQFGCFLILRTLSLVPPLTVFSTALLFSSAVFTKLVLPYQ